MLHYEGGYDKEYYKFENNPDNANSLSCCLWELSSTSNHYHSFNKLVITTPDKVLFKYDISRNGNFRPFVDKSKFNKYSMIKHPPNDLNNNISMKNIVNWFKIKHRNNKYKNKQEKRLKKITKAVIIGNNMSKKAIKYYANLCISTGYY